MQYLADTIDKSQLFLKSGFAFFGMVVFFVLSFYMGYRLIRSGARSKKTWKIILGVLLTGFIGYVYYANLREKIKDEEAKKEFEQLKAELSRIKQKKTSEKNDQSESN